MGAAPQLSEVEDGSVCLQGNLSNFTGGSLVSLVSLQLHRLEAGKWLEVDRGEAWPTQCPMALLTDPLGLESP